MTSMRTRRVQRRGVLLALLATTLWMLLSSFKTNSEINGIQSSLWPRHFTFANYGNVQESNEDNNLSERVISTSQATVAAAGLPPEPKPILSGKLPSR